MKLETWIVLIAAVIVPFTCAYIGNEQFGKNIRKVLTWLKIKLIKGKFFYSVYIPFLIILGLIYYFIINVRYIETYLILYAIWITGWTIYLKKKRKNVSKVVSCKLADKVSEKGNNGLIYIRWEDGDAVEEIFRGDSVRRTNVSKLQYYIYFAFREDIVEYFRSAKSVLIAVEIFDFGMEEYKNQPVLIQYDSRDESHANPKYKHPDKPFFLSGTNTWQTASFLVKDGHFKGRQNGKADFRIGWKPRSVSNRKHLRIDKDLYVRRIIAVALNE